MIDMRTHRVVAEALPADPIELLGLHRSKSRRRVDAVHSRDTGVCHDQFAANRPQDERSNQQHVKYLCTCHAYDVQLYIGPIGITDLPRMNGAANPLTIRC